MAGRVTAILVPFAVVWLYAAGGLAYVLGGVSSALVLQAVLALLYREETNGRSLEAIAGDAADDGHGSVSAAGAGVLASR